MGQPKSALQIHGQPILRFLLDWFQWPGPTMVVTAPGREHPPGCESFDLEAVDPESGQGPLRGILTALQNSPTSAVIVTTVDMPCVHPLQLHWLCEQSGDGVMIQNGSRIEPFPSLFRTPAATVIEEQLKRHRRSVHGLATLPGFRTIAAPQDWPADWMTNLNTPDEYRAFIDSQSGDPPTGTAPQTSVRPGWVCGCCSTRCTRNA